MAYFDELIAMARIVDRNGHGHEVCQRAADPFQRLIDEGETGARLRFKIVRDRHPVQIDQTRLTRKPDCLAALRDDRRRKGP